MKYQVLSSLKNNEKVFTNVVCCSRDWQNHATKYMIKARLFLLSGSREISDQSMGRRRK